MAGNEASVSQTEQIVVCNKMDGQCHNVDVISGHVALEGTEQQIVPVATDNGEETMTVIVVDEQHEAEHYGIV